MAKSFKMGVVEYLTIKDVAPLIGVKTVPAVHAAMKTAGVTGKAYGNAIYLTSKDVAVLKTRPGRGRPRLDGMAPTKKDKGPMADVDSVVFGIPTNADDVSSIDIG